MMSRTLQTSPRSVLTHLLIHTLYIIHKQITEEIGLHLVEFHKENSNCLAVDTSPTEIRDDIKNLKISNLTILSNEKFNIDLGILFKQ